MRTKERSISQSTYRSIGTLNYLFNRLLSKLIPARTGISIEEVQGILRNPFVSVQCHKTVGVITTSGNRLQDLKLFMPSIVENLNEHSSLTISVYADKEETDAFLRNEYSDLVLSGKLHVITTNAETFNKAMAVNIAFNEIKTDLVFLVDSDIQLIDRDVLNTCALHFVLNKFDLISYGFWGQQMMERHLLEIIGGLNPELQNHDCKFTNGVYGDDMDLIVRVVASGRKFLFISKHLEYVFKPLFLGFTIFLTKVKKNEFNSFVHQKEVSAIDRPINDYENSLYFKRIGKYTPRKDEALIRYHAWQKFGAGQVKN